MALLVHYCSYLVFERPSMNHLKHCVCSPDFGWICNRNVIHALFMNSLWFRITVITFWTSDCNDPAKIFSCDPFFIFAAFFLLVGEPLWDFVKIFDELNLIKDPHLCQSFLSGWRCRRFLSSGYQQVAFTLDRYVHKNCWVALFRSYFCNGHSKIGFLMIYMTIIG